MLFGVCNLHPPIINDVCNLHPATREELNTGVLGGNNPTYQLLTTCLVYIVPRIYINMRWLGTPLNLGIRLCVHKLFVVQLMKFSIFFAYICAKYIISRKENFTILARICFGFF